MSKQDYNKQQMLGEWDNQHKQPVDIKIEFLVTTKGEVVPFEWVKRLSVSPFDNIDQFADTLTAPPIQSNEVYAILNDGTNCSFDLTVMEFTQHISDEHHGQYLSTDIIRKLIMLQFAKTNKGMPDGYQARVRPDSNKPRTV